MGERRGPIFQPFEHAPYHLIMPSLAMLNTEVILNMNSCNLTASLET
jgi:hypothetical protein